MMLALGDVDGGDGGGWKLTYRSSTLTSATQVEMVVVLTVDGNGCVLLDERKGVGEKDITSRTFVFIIKL